MAQLVTLPAELLDGIFRFLRRPEQKVTRLACHRFASILERHVFAALVIHVDHHWNVGNQNPWISLIQSLSAGQSRIPQYARKLRMHLCMPHVFRRRSRAQFDNPKITILQRYLLEALRTLKLLETVECEWSDAVDSAVNDEILCWLNTCETLKNLTLVVDKVWPWSECMIASASLWCRLNSLSITGTLHISTFTEFERWANGYRKVLELCTTVKRLELSSHNFYGLEIQLEDLQVLKLKHYVPRGQLPFGRNLRSLNISIMSPELGQALVENGIWLREIHIQFENRALVDYLKSYSAIVQVLSILEPRETPVCVELDEAILKHSDSLQSLEINSLDFWSHDRTLASYLWNLTNLKLERSIASIRQLHSLLEFLNTTHLPRLVDLQIYYLINDSTQAQKVLSELSNTIGLNPNVCVQIQCLLDRGYFVLHQSKDEYLGFRRIAVECEPMSPRRETPVRYGLRERFIAERAFGGTIGTRLYRTLFDRIDQPPKRK